MGAGGAMTMGCDGMRPAFMGKLLSKTVRCMNGFELRNICAPRDAPVAPTPCNS